MNKGQFLNQVMELNGKTVVSPADAASFFNTNKINFSSTFSFIQSYRDSFIHFLMEQWDYINLPEGLDKYRLEDKVLRNGCVGFTKLSNILKDKNIEDRYIVVNVFNLNPPNIYGEPNEVQINEPYFPAINGKKLINNEEVFLIRNNINYKSYDAPILRLLTAMEKTLFQLEKSITSILDKLIINTDESDLDSTESVEAKNLEAQLTGENLVIYRRTNNSNGDGILKNGNEEPYQVIKLTDKSQSLFQLFHFFKEQVKELTQVGGGSPSIHKKERLITSEVEQYSSLSDGNLSHMISIRRNDIERINKYFGLNIQIVAAKDLQKDSSNEDGDNYEE